ncbi:MAG: bifunctional metallophosphatase/5'-nucleotidase [Pseudanabaenaceae cyanobacterium SKYGB_i_bin29]|nr:bifunctional metallophosphatase/5'-nucleotidase [Pseudanabaenaceae cyanobacterium SKYG29]MDW8420730.1 bifunctional metallophosphatase/5'-nucleotidase [Pseudanabaenaceae cyanobacterium SKYGB_i_bin29]
MNKLFRYVTVSLAICLLIGGIYFINRFVTSSSSFTLQILHASDLEASLNAIKDAPNFAAVVDALRPTFANTIVVSSGDNYLPSPFYNASTDPSLAARYNFTPGKADIEIANAIGLQASAFGNHDFDQGLRQVRDLITPDSKRGYSGANFPYLSANLDFQPGDIDADSIAPDGEEVSQIAHKVAHTAVITVNGKKIGLLGATTTRLAQISSPGKDVVVKGSVDNTDQVDSKVLQPYVDSLTKAGIKYIILLAHLQQIQNEIELASQLRDVDVIIGGGSHQVLAKPTDRLRQDPPDRPFDTYPIQKTTATGEPIVIVNTGANYRYVGRLVVTFDDKGIITRIDPVSGAYATDPEGVKAVNGKPNPRVSQIVAEIARIIETKEKNIFGQTTTFLNGIRNEVRTEETNLGNLVADANLDYAKTIDPATVISFKNGGGIRAPIGAVTGNGGSEPVQRIPPLANRFANKPAGAISQLDIETALAFNNSLTLVTLTAAQLKQTMEHAVSQSAPGATPGRFPQISGFSFSFDPQQPVGQRIQSLVVGQDVVVKEGKLQGNPDRTFRAVTLNYLADGGDDYPLPRFPNLDRKDLATTKPIGFDTPGSEQYALATYLRKIGTVNLVDTAAQADQRIKNLALQ